MEEITLITSVCQTNTYILIDNGEAVVIDPGDNADAILKIIHDRNAQPKHVLITHGHYDHIGAAAELQKSGALLYMSQTDHALVDFDEQGLFGAPRGKFDLDVPVSDGKILNIIGHDFKVISTAGHTPGGVCYVMDDRVIFSGDTLFRSSVGRTDFPFADSSALKASVKKLFALPHDYTVCAGHGPKTTLDFERKYNPYVD